MPTVNERILHKLGPRGSVVVAVPQDWLRYYGLKAGDRFDVIANGDITIRPKRRAKDGRVQPNPEQLSRIMEVNAEERGAKPKKG
jgi:bifunctional DNA-binding transcriptional regulator/antitoxin component of YhaV-PrlF toxin-antitoxin module